MITLRVEVSIPLKEKRPERVRVVLKDRGALFFAFRHKLVSIPLYKAGWRLLPGDVWQNEQAMAVPINVPKLLRRKHLALQLYCLRGSSVQHKGIFNFRRIMEQLQHDELLLAMRYPKCDGKKKKVPPHAVSEGQDRGVKQGVGKALSGGIQTRNMVMERANVANVVPKDSGMMSLPAHTSHHLESTSSVTTDSTAKSVDVHVLECEPSSIITRCSPIIAHQQDVHCSNNVTEQRTDLQLTRRRRFTDSGAVIPELLREYDETKAKKEAEKAVKEKASVMPRRPDGQAACLMQEFDEREDDKTKAKEKAEAAAAAKEKPRTQPCRKLMWAKCIGLHLDDLMCTSVMVAWALVYVKDRLPKDWIVVGMGVALMLAGACVYVCVSRLWRGRGTSVRDASTSTEHLTSGDPERPTKNSIIG